MGIFSKLFGRNKSKAEVRRIESEVEKVIEPPTETIEEPAVSPDQVVIAEVLRIKKAGKFNKDYQLVHNFLVNNDAENQEIKGHITGLEVLTADVLSPETISFIKQYRVRGLKCSDEKFQNWITNIAI